MIAIARADRRPQRTVGNNHNPYEGFANRGDCAAWHYIRSDERIYQIAVDCVCETCNRRDAADLLRQRLRAIGIRHTGFFMEGPVWGPLNRATLLAALVGINTQALRRAS